MPISIRQVAARAGVSLATVSKALNSAPGAQVAPETRERVRRAAEELGYHPSAAARALVRKRFDTIGIVPPLGMASPLCIPFFASLFDATLTAASERQQNITVFMRQTWVDARRSLPAFRDGRCDSYLVFTQSPDTDLFAALADAEIPFALLNQTVADPRAPCVDVEDTAGARTLTEHLIARGHRRIAMLCGDPRALWIQERLSGYRDGLENAGIPFDPRLVASDSFRFETVQGQVDKLIDLPSAQRPTALFCGNDTLAFCALRALARRGLRVPEDISVAGFDDVREAGNDHQSLTTMRQPYAQIAETALDLLLNPDPAVRAPKIRLPATLIERGSTGTPTS